MSLIMFFLKVAKIRFQIGLNFALKLTYFSIILETECNSWNAQKHVKCPHSNQCVKNISTCTADDRPDRENRTSCPNENNQEYWRCNDGRCILRSLVCDGHKTCADHSDENEGCSLFPNTGSETFIKF